MPTMKLLPEEKEWLQINCINYIIISAARRIQFLETINAASERDRHIITTAIIHALNIHACQGSQVFFQKQSEGTFDSFIREFMNNFNLLINKQSLRIWHDFFVKIEDYCFREMQALQIVKLEYKKLPNEELKNKVISKLREEFIPHFERTEGLDQEQLVAAAIEKSQFEENCRKIQKSYTPL